jgi:hypothetical protein
MKDMSLRVEMMRSSWYCSMTERSAERRRERRKSATHLLSVWQVPHCEQQVEEVVDPSEEVVDLLPQLILDLRLVEELSKLSDEERSRDLVALNLDAEKLVETVGDFCFDDTKVLREGVL